MTTVGSQQCVPQASRDPGAGRQVDSKVDYLEEGEAGRELLLGWTFSEKVEVSDFDGQCSP